MLGENLKTARSRANLSRNDLAEMVGVEANTIGRWENNIRHPGSDMLIKLSRALSVSVAVLFGETADMYVPASSRFGIEVGKVAGGAVFIPLLNAPLSSYRYSPFPLGESILANAASFIAVSDSFVGTISDNSNEKPFLLKTAGESLIRLCIPAGAYILINPAEKAYDGDAALVQYGESKTVAIKRVYWTENNDVELHSVGSDVVKIGFGKKDMNNGLVSIIGKLMWYCNTPTVG